MEQLDLRLVTPQLQAFLAEDLGRGDRTSDATVDPEATGRARIEARAEGVIAGLDVARRVFELVDRGFSFEAVAHDGARVAAGDPLLRIEGRLSPLLTAERTALNLLGRLSGVATLTARFVDAAGGTRTRIVDTRKTTPGLRLLEKYAVRVGGGHNHRFGLDDGVLIKDNHIAAAGGVAAALERARTRVPHGLRIEVEVTDLDELDDALSGGADAVLLDNMAPDMISEAVRRAAGRVVLEASGGITLGNVGVYASTGVDLISVGALTHSAPALDVSLEVEG